MGGPTVTLAFIALGKLEGQFKSILSITLETVIPHTSGSPCDQQVQPDLGGINLVNRDL